MVLQSVLNQLSSRLKEYTSFISFFSWAQTKEEWLEMENDNQIQKY